MIDIYAISVSYKVWHLYKLVRNANGELVWEFHWYSGTYTPLEKYSPIIINEDLTKRALVGNSPPKREYKEGDLEPTSGLS